MRPFVFTFLMSYAVMGLCAALGQTGGGAPPEVSPAMEEQGLPLGKEALGADAALLAEQRREAASDLPIVQLSRIARQPVTEATEQTRSAADAEIYRTVSPSVVMVATKDGAGSGSLIGPFGEVLTNWHVVRGYGEVGVVFKPATEGQIPGKDDILTGFVVKVDEVADLALVKVANHPGGARFLRLGDPSEISVGLDVHAIGHPLGGRWTYTKGIISQYRLGFEWPGEDGSKHKADLIQTQTPINPGNSGGPLISESGALLGVNTFKAEGEGLNFAISVGDVKRFIARSGNRLAEGRPATAAKSECVPKEVSKARNKENNATLVAFDMLCTGKIDAVFVYPDDKSQAVVLKMDRNHDGRADVLFFDLKRRGKWDMSWWDENFDGQWTLVGYHDDGSLKPTRFESFEAYKKRMAKR
jgi:S1-C subfamily serine protease